MKLVTALAACVIAFAVAAPAAAQQTTTPTLYKRLGGYDAIAAVTDDFVGRLACDAGARFVKTSTGFHSSGGATVDDVRLLRAAVGPEFGVKASGGIRSLADAQAMIGAGANRLGTSASAAILGAIEAAESAGS